MAARRRDHRWTTQSMHIGGGRRGAVTSAGVNPNPRQIEGLIGGVGGAGSGAQKGGEAMGEEVDEMREGDGLDRLG
jgi:hypothetical protein